MLEGYEGENGLCYENEMKENLIFSQAKTRPKTI